MKQQVQYNEKEAARPVGAGVGMGGVGTLVVARVPLLTLPVLWHTVAPHPRAAFTIPRMRLPQGSPLHILSTPAPTEPNSFLPLKLVHIGYPLRIPWFADLSPCIILHPLRGNCSQIPRWTAYLRTLLKGVGKFDQRWF